MPTAHSGDVSLYYETAGAGDDTVVFVGDVGFGAWQWAWQHRAVAGPFRAVVFDHRGVGQSDTPPGPYSIDDLASDVAAILADAAVTRAHLVGAGLGGLVALDLAHGSGRVRSLALLGCGVDDAEPIGAFAPPDDTAALRESTETLLSDSFCREQPDVVEQVVEWRANEDAPRAVWEAHAAAVDGYEPPPLYEVTTPALVVHGERDRHWPVGGARALADDLPRGELLSFDAGRLVGVERSRVVNDRLVGHVESAAASGSESGS
jgi:pimeloyl-ACP methyl ester carboxylesterase